MSGILFLSIFQAALSIYIEKNISSVYYLSNREYFPLLLSDYFAGDSLTYSISSDVNSTSFFLSNTSLAVTPMQNSSSGLLYPKRNTVIKTICAVYASYCNTAFYGSGNNLTIFTYNINTGFEDILFNVSFEDPIEFYSLVFLNGNFSIFVVTTDEVTNTNSFFNVSLNYDDGFLDIESQTKLELSPFLQMLRITDVAQGDYSSYLSIVGFSKNTGYITHLHFTENYKESAHLAICKQDLINTIFVVSNQQIDYALLVEENNLISVVELTNLQLSINNSVYLPSVNSTAFSMQIVGVSDFYIFIGIVSQTVIVSADFQRVFIKSLSANISEVFVAPTPSNYFFLTKGLSQTDIYILDASTEFNVLFSFQLPFVNRTTAWLVLSYFSQEYLVCYLNQGSLQFVNIVYAPAQLNFTHSESLVNYALTVTDSFGVSIEESFLVSPVFEDDSLIPLINLQTVVCSFDELEAEVELSLYDYIAGSYIDNAVISIESEDFHEEFNVSSQFTPILSTPTDIEVNLTDVNNNTLNNIVLTTDGFVLYNLHTIEVYVSGKCVSSKTYTMTIVEILFVSPNYFIVYCNKDDLISVNDITSLPDQCGKNTPCEQIFANYPYVGCNLGVTISIYKFVSNSLLLVGALQIKGLQNLIDFTISNNYLLTISASGDLFIYDLEDLVKTRLLEPIFNKFVGENATNILADSQNYYIYFDNYTLNVYDTSVNYLKDVNFSEPNQLLLAGGFMYIVYADEIKVCNLSDFIINAFVAKVNSPFLINIAVNQTSLVELHPNHALVYKINPNYNSLHIKISIHPTAELSQMSYFYNSTLTVTQEYNEVNNTVPFVFMINGQTIFVNSSAVQSIQTTQMQLSCGNTLNIPLEDIFLGQNLGVSLNSKNKIVEIGQRLMSNFSVLFNQTVVDLAYVDDYLMYIAIVEPNVVMALDANFTVLNQTSIKRDEHKCEAYSITVVYVDKSVVFAVGVECFLQNWNTSKVVSFSQNFFQFVMFDGTLKQLNEYKLLSRPQLMKSTSSVKGVFAIIFTKKYENVTPNSFFSNFITICPGQLEKNKVTVDTCYEITAAELSLPSMYIVDFDLLYYPLTKSDFLYLLDVEGNLIVLSYNFESHTKSTVLFPIGNFPAAISLCGQNLFISYSSSRVDQFFLQNWSQPVFLKTISPFGSGFETIAGSLRCSNNNYAKYLLMTLIRVDLSMYIQIIDTTANELASIISQNRVSDVEFGIFTLFSTPDSISVLSLNFSVFVVQDYIMTINPPENCKHDSEVSFELIASNTVSENKSVNFTLSISENYNQGSVSVSSPSLWAILILSSISVILLSILYFLFRRCCKKKNLQTLEPQFDLFNYEFMEANFDFR